MTQTLLNPRLPSIGVPLGVVKTVSITGKRSDATRAIVGEAMQDEEELARTFVDSEAAASERLEGLVLALHKRKLERFTNDPEVYQLYRRVVDERPGLIHDYAARMTKLVARILADGVRKKEYKIDDIDAAAEVVRDAVTVYVHPAHVEAAAKRRHRLEPAIKRMISTLSISATAPCWFACLASRPTSCGTCSAWLTSLWPHTKHPSSAKSEPPQVRLIPALKQAKAEYAKPL